MPEPPSEAALTHDQAERIDRLRIGAEALKQLKPQEIRALVLSAEGYSYKQIQEITGWTYTKVNRCLTEGRKAFLERVAGIEAGSECERLAPLLSKLVDGEATADDLATLRPHIRTCLSCRAALREYRSAPATAAALVPAAAFVASGRSPFARRARAARSRASPAWTQKAQTAVEMASAQKVAAVAASTAVIGGGAAVTVQKVERRAEPAKRIARVEREKPEPAPRPRRSPRRRPPHPPGARRSAAALRRRTPRARGEAKDAARTAGVRAGMGVGCAQPAPIRNRPRRRRPRRRPLRRYRRHRAEAGAVRSSPRSDRKLGGVLGDDLLELLHDRVPDDHSRQTLADAYVGDWYGRWRAERNPGARVLDLGCGAGDSIDVFRRFDPAVRWVGLDLPCSPEVDARRRTDAEFATFDGESIPFRR